jgi:putative oxidoreductase
MERMAWKVIALALRVALAWIFLKAVVLKIWDFAHWRSATPDFALAIQHYQILAWPDLTMLLAVYLPWLEIITALALLTQRLRLGAITLFSGLTIVFLAALASAWHRGLDIACGCFGKDEVSTDFPAMLARDLCILAGLAILFVIEWRRLRHALASSKYSFPLSRT